MSVGFTSACKLLACGSLECDLHRSVGIALHSIAGCDCKSEAVNTRKAFWVGFTSGISEHGGQPVTFTAQRLAELMRTRKLQLVLLCTSTFTSQSMMLNDSLGIFAACFGAVTGSQQGCSVARGVSPVQALALRRVVGIQGLSKRSAYNSTGGIPVN